MYIRTEEPNKIQTSAHRSNKAFSVFLHAYKIHCATYYITKIFMLAKHFTYTKTPAS